MSFAVPPTQIPDKAILDLFGRQAYLGNEFSASSGYVTQPTITENPYLYLKNPSTNTKSAFIHKLEWTFGGSVGLVLGRSYLNPTVSSNGLSTSPVNARPSSGVSSTISSFTSPVIAAGTKQTSTITTVADVAGSLNNKYFFITGFNTTFQSVDNFYVWFNVSSTGTDPMIPNRMGIEVDISTGATANAVATALATALNSSDFSAPAPVANVVSVTVLVAGSAPFPADSTGGTKTNFVFTNGTPGSTNFGTVLSFTGASAGTTAVSNNLIVLDPGNSILLTVLVPNSSNQPIASSAYWYEINVSP